MHAKQHCLVYGLVLALSILPGSQSQATDAPEPTPPSVVMVCNHGAVKSVIATLLFDQEAQERGLSVRAISRGLAPYEAIPGKIAKALENDGFDVSAFEPRNLTDQDVAAATRVVAIGSDLAAFEEHAEAAILQWDDVPPASVDYAASKASILAHVRALLDELTEQ